jgi:hypothetical protein
MVIGANLSLVIPPLHYGMTRGEEIGNDIDKEKEEDLAPTLGSSMSIHPLGLLPAPRLRTTIER